MKKNYLILSLATLAVLVSLVFLIGLNSTVNAQNDSSASPVSGNATIENMAGYFINFDGHSVTYSSSSGITGNAWSPEYGWVNFNGWTATVPSFQNDNETPDWATGAIKLHGSDGGSNGNMSYGVTFDPVTGQGSGYAWGGNVLGWINFSGVNITVNQTNGLCSTVHYNCSQGTSVNNVNGANTWTWDCNGTNGGVNAIGCSENKNNNNGACSATHYICTQGTSVNNVDGTNAWTWDCNGINGGTNAPGCSEIKNAVNGSCSATHYICTQGTSVNNVDGTNAWTWDCNGTNGGTNAIGCSENKIACSQNDINDQSIVSCYCPVHPTDPLCIPFCVANPTLCSGGNSNIKIPNWKEN